jgi:hypothetical protein
MTALLIAESKVGKHHQINNPNIKIIETRGSSIVSITTKGYKISEKFLKTIKDHKPSFVLIGTDLDLQGTKIATLVKHSLDNLGIKSYRFALTEKGYARLGSFLDKGRFKTYFLSEQANIRFARNMKKMIGISIGRKTFTILGAVWHFKKQKVKVKNLNRYGSNTFTAITKTMIKGYSPNSGMKYLQKLYYEDKIPYPRVDNDYITEKTYDLYPHPNLRKYGFKEDIVMPLEEQEFEFNYKTLYLQLCNERLITPSTISYYDQKLKTFFFNIETLNPKPMFEPLLEIAEDYYLRTKESYKKELEILYNPKLKLSKPIPISKINKMSEYELELLFDEISEDLNKEEEDLALKEQLEMIKRQYLNIENEQVFKEQTYIRKKRKI